MKIIQLPNYLEIVLLAGYRHTYQNYHQQVQSGIKTYLHYLISRFAMSNNM